jgi:hypothetical protein
MVKEEPTTYPDALLLLNAAVDKLMIAPWNYVTIISNLYSLPDVAMMMKSGIM